MAPLSLSEIPTLSLLYRLSKLSPASRPLVQTSSARYNSLISLIRTDITKLRVSAIVNAANESLLGGGGVDGAIHRAAGPGLFKECEMLDGCDTGSAKMTSAYELPCDKVIHAVGPIYYSANRRREGLAAELLAGCYRTSLDLASQAGCESIAFSALSTGVYGYPSGEAAETAIGEVRRWLEEKGEGCGGLQRIVFCCFEVKDERAYQEWLPKYFPPTEEDVPGSKSNVASTNDDAETDAENLKKSMPDPPHNDPVNPGEPATKKQKALDSKTQPKSGVGIGVVGGLAPASDDDWETIEKPDLSANRTYPGITSDEMTESQIQAEMRKSEIEEEKALVLNAMERGGDPPRSMLEKDW